MKTRDPSKGGSRSDDSTLFSLRTLAERAAPPRADAARTRDDSGLIDLAALAAAEPSPAERPALDVAPFVGVGLFDVPQKAPDPLPPPPQPSPVRAPRRRTIAVVAGVVTALAVVSTIAVAVNHAPGGAELPPVNTLHTASVPASPPPEPAKTEPPPPAEAKPVETAAPAPSAPLRNPARLTPKPVGTTVAKTAPPKPAPACDLMCQMQRSVAKPR